MKNMKNVLVILMMLLVAFSFASCSSTADSVDLVATESPATAEASGSSEDLESQMRAIFGIEDEDVDIASYRIRGVGEDGASFDWVEVTEPQVAIAGVRRGQWTIYAQALNEDGDVVASGQLETFLSSDAPTTSLMFTENDGVGDVHTQISWNTAQVINPSVEVYVKKVDGNFASRPSSEVTYGEAGTAWWDASGLEAGSYVARFVFKDGETVIGGAAAALRIITGYTSVGFVDMTVGDMNTTYSINLDNIPADVTTGALLNENGLVTFTTEGSASGLSYEWYINGEKVEGETGRALDLDGRNLAKGFYRVDLVVQGGRYGSINSFSIVVQLQPENVFSTVSGTVAEEAPTTAVVPETAPVEG